MIDNLLRFVLHIFHLLKLIDSDELKIFDRYQLNEVLEHDIFYSKTKKPTTTTTTT